jgi:hypothetical protein
MRQRTLQLLILAAISSTGAIAQINCISGPASTKLVCAFPYAAGLLTNETALGGQAGIQAANEAAGKVATGFNSAIAAQVSQLPLASASAGTVVVYSGGVPETFNNLGPILTDRAQTVGRHRFFIGFTASQFVFTDIDGISLGKLPFSFVATAYVPNTTTVSSYTYTAEDTDLHFKIDQFVGVATYGLGSRFDVSVIVPVEYVSMGATTYNTTGYILDANDNLIFGPYSSPNTHTPGTASGIGDITFNGKGELWRGEHATVSAGMNFRVPTGDDQNYLGSGAYGYNPYLVFGYLSKVSPHAKIGYQWNSATELNNPTGTAGGNLALPGGLNYDVGADWAMLKRLTVAGDLLGNQYVNAPRYVVSSVPLPDKPSTASLTTIIPETSTYTINNLSTGVKLNPFRNLVLSANVLFQLNNNGLRSRPTPLLGISYKF